MKIEHGSTVAPLFRTMPFLGTTAVSPWPGRLMNLEAWQRPERDEKEVLREYNEGLYRDLLELWEAFARDLHPTSSRLGSPLRFYHRVIKHLASGLEKNKAIYKTCQDRHLFSLGDEFMIGDLVIASMLHFDMIIRYVDEHLARHPLRTVVEPGCGTGTVLFHLHEHLDIDHIVGGDLCPNAVKLASNVATTFGVSARFQPFDYRRPESLHELTRGLDNYLLLTCHSLEQTQVAQIGFLDNVLALPNPPALVMHFEPIAWNDESLMGQLCKRYAEKNRYNLDLPDALARYQSSRRLEIVDCRKRCFGASAFNPTSLLCWKPLPR